MSFKKIIVGISLPLFLSSLLCSQSLVELSKKEKERREKLKDKKKVVITNADLANLKKRPALTTSRAVFAPGGSGTEASPAEQPSVDKAEPSEAKASVPQAKASEPADIDRSEQQKDSPQELEAKWKQARDQVNLLTTKMNGLWQEFYSMDDMSSRENIQREISETSLRLQKAKEDEASARKEYNQARIKARRTRLP